MVNNGLFKTALFLSLMANSYISIASPQLILKVYSENAELGRPIRAELYGVSLNEKLANINLKALDKSFGVVNEYSSVTRSDERWPKQETQILRLKIYPRTVGKVLIPQLNFNGKKTKAQEINVARGKTSVPEIIVPSSSPYQRQLFNVYIQVITPVSTARLTPRQQSFNDRINRKKLDFKRTRRPDGTYQLQLGWSFNVINSGDYFLSLPVIEYSESGVLRKLFYVEQPKVTVQALPLYLSPTTTVGKVKINSEVSSDVLNRTNSVYYWDITLEGNVLNSHQLPALLRQIKSNEKISFLPVKSTRSTSVSSDVFISRVTHSVPFKILSSGLKKLPALDIQYFDPSSGKIINIKHKAKSVFALNLFWSVVFFSLLLAVFVLIFMQTKRKWKRFRYLRRKNAAAIELLRKQKGKKDIRESVRLSAEAESWPGNITLTQWAKNWREKYNTDNEFEKMTASLSSVLYNTSTKDNEVVNASVANQLASTIRLKKSKSRFKSAII